MTEPARVLVVDDKLEMARTLAEGLADLGPERASILPFTDELIPIREVHRRYAAWALAQLGGNRTATAQRLGIDVKTLRAWLEDKTT